jgi:hypothetical protein
MELQPRFQFKVVWPDLSDDSSLITHSLHGLQFKATAMKTVPPTTTEGIERYLGSGLVKGIGPRGRYVAALLHAGSKIGVSVGRFRSGTWQGERAGIVNPDSYTLAGYDLLLGQSEPSLRRKTVRLDRHYAAEWIVASFIFRARSSLLRTPFRFFLLLLRGKLHESVRLLRGHLELLPQPSFPVTSANLGECLEEEPASFYFVRSLDGIHLF